MKHFHEQLVRRHGYKLSYTVTRLSLQAAGLVAKAKRRGAHRKKRVRRPLPGMLLFQDGSTHRWIGALQRDLDLVVTLDDATGAIYSAILVEEEGTLSSFLGLAETIAAHGLFRAFYTDRGSHYFLTPKGGGKVDKTKPTQVGRALAQLGITHIASYSPQGRGRMERVFGTLQKRLPPELRLARITTVAGGQPLPEGAVRARLQRPLRGAGGRARLGLHPLCRPAARGRPVHPGGPRGRGRQLRYLEAARVQIPPQRHRQHYVRATVRVHEYPDGRLAIFDGPRCLARFDQKAAIVCLARPLNSARRSGLWICGQRSACPQTPQAQQ